MIASRINVVQSMFLLILAVGITNHVLIVPLMLNASHRDSWISALYAIPPLVLWTSLIYFIMKTTKQQSLFEWFKARYHPAIAWIVVMPLLILTLMICFVTLRDTSAWTKTTYLPKTPLPLTASLFMLFAFYAAHKGLRTITIAAGILLPGVIAFGLFVMTVNFQFKDYTYLFPVFTQGQKPVMKGMVYALGGLVEFVLLLGFQQHLSKPFRYSSLLLLTLGVTGLVFGPIIASIAIFGPYEASDQRYPAFEQWRMVLIGKFISHLDFLSIYQWLSGSLIRISLSLFLFFDLLRLKAGNKRTALMIGLSVLLVAFVSQHRLSDENFFYFLQAYFPWETAFFYAFPFALLLLIAMKREESS
ncbi:endospore germination permease [Cohnella suwonensis]|uniref:Endospore germination permease n=1 Tax=Cohnella suwonensis TaxID=696072 RepID=A0ABW0LS12_9BACL